MENKEKVYYKALKEVLRFLDATPKEMVDKIPKELMDTFRENADMDYECNFDVNDNNANVLDETKAILVMLYYEYMCEDSAEKEAYEKELSESARIAKLEQYSKIMEKEDD